MYILTIVNLLCPLCYEIPCITYLPVLSLAMIETVLPPSLIMFVFRVINHFSVAISQAVMVLAYVIITIRPLVRSATVHTILFNQTFVSVKTEIVQVRYTLNNVIAIIEFMVKCQCNYHHSALCKILSLIKPSYL